MTTLKNAEIYRLSYKYKGREKVHEKTYMFQLDGGEEISRKVDYLWRDAKRRFENRLLEMIIAEIFSGEELLYYYKDEEEGDDFFKIPRKRSEEI